MNNQFVNQFPTELNSLKDEVTHAILFANQQKKMFTSARLGDKCEPNLYVNRNGDEWGHSDVNFVSEVYKL